MILGLIAFGIGGFTLLHLFLGLFRLCGRACGVRIVPVPAYDLRLDFRNYCWDVLNERLGRLQCGPGWGFLTHVGNLKSIPFGQRILVETRSDGGFVHRPMCAHRSNRCC
jgi:hypothetical protein